MAADNLRLQVVLEALDRASAPFRKIMAGSKGLSQQLQSQREALKRLQASQRDVAAFRQQAEATQATRQQHQAATTRVRELTEQIAQADAPTRKLTREFAAAKRSAALLKTQHQQQSSELQRLRSGLERAGISTRQLGQHERRLRTELAAANAAMDTQRKRLAAMDAAMMRSKRIHSAGMSAAGHGAGLAFGGTAALRAEMFPIGQAMSFESAMADVKKVVDFDTPAQFAQMGRDVEDLSMRLPMLPTEIAKIVAAAGQAAIPRQELLRFSEDAAKMGVAFDSTAEEAGQTMATWRTAFRMGQDEVVVLADKINHLGNTGPASVIKISEVVNRIGALGEVAGLGSGPLAALGATVAGMGIESEVSATGIKNMLLTLAAGEGAAKRQVEVLEKLGLSATGMAKAMQDDAGGAILTVLEKLKELPKHEQAANMTALFGRESVGAIAPLLTNLGLLKSNFDKVSDAEVYGGSMAAEYASRVATSENALQLLKNQALVLAQSIGQTLLPQFKQLMDRTAQITKRGTEWIRANPALVGTLAKLAIAGTAVATVLGGLLVGGGLAAMALTQMHKAVMLVSGGGGLGQLLRQLLSVGSRALPMLLNGARLLLPVLGGVSAPVLAVGAALAVVAALVWKYWGPIKAFMVGMWQGVGEAVGPLMTDLRTALEPLAPLWDAISGAIGSAWSWFKQLFAPMEATSAQLQGATDNGRSFGRMLATVMTANLRLAVSAVGWLVRAFAKILPAIRNVMGGAWTYLQGAWSMIVGVFTLNGGKILAGLQGVWAGLNQILLGWPQRMVQAGIDMISGLIRGIGSMAGAAANAVGGVASGVIDRFKGLLGIHSPSRVFAQLGDFTMQGLAGGLGRSQKHPLAQVSSLGERMRQAGTGIALGIAAAPAMATAPMVGAQAMQTALARGPAPSSITIHIHAAPGMDPSAIGQEVRRQLEAMDREKSARRQSRLSD
ncbi:TP901 family phage tail tape measure protein [Xanthomonas sp. 60]